MTYDSAIVKLWTIISTSSYPIYAFVVYRLEKDPGCLKKPRKSAPKLGTKNTKRKRRTLRFQATRTSTTSSLSTKNTKRVCNTRGVSSSGWSPILSCTILRLSEVSLQPEGTPAILWKWNARVFKPHCSQSTICLSFLVQSSSRLRTHDTVLVI